MMGDTVPSRILTYWETEEHHPSKLLLGGNGSLLGKVLSLLVNCCKLRKGAALSLSTSHLKRIQDY